MQTKVYKVSTVCGEVWISIGLDSEGIQYETSTWDDFMVPSNEQSGTTNDINEEHKKGLNKIKTHGQLFLQQSKLSYLDIEVRHKWLYSAHLQFEMKSLICTAQ